MSSPCLAFFSKAERLARAYVMLKVFISYNPSHITRPKPIAFPHDIFVPAWLLFGENSRHPVLHFRYFRDAKLLDRETGTGSLLLANLLEGQTHCLDWSAQFSGAKQSSLNGQRRSRALLSQRLGETNRRTRPSRKRALPRSDCQRGRLGRSRSRSRDVPQNSRDIGAIESRQASQRHAAGSAVPTVSHSCVR